MDFMWAVEQMKEGKKVRVREWVTVKYIQRLNYRTDTDYCTDDGKPIDWLGPMQTESKEWEIYEEPKKTLSNKELGRPEGYCRAFAFNDVKQFIIDVKNIFRKLDDDLIYCRISRAEYNELLKEIPVKIEELAGEGLI